MIDVTAATYRDVSPGSVPVLTDRPATTPRLAIFMLSTFRVTIDGRPPDRQLGTKGKPLLKILAAQRHRTVTRDALIEMLWPGTDPSAGRTSLKVTAHNLRSLLEPQKAVGASGSWIIFEHGTYRLNPDAEIWIDVESMEQHARRGRRYEVEGDIRRAEAEYDAADALYSGDFLEEDIYEDWTIVRREELRDTYLDVVSRLMHLARARSDHRAAIKYCHRILNADPCREDAYRTLMQSHGAMNQLARAGAWYAVCRNFLHREMAAEPHAETTQAFEDLFRRRDA